MECYDSSIYDDAYRSHGDCEKRDRHNCYDDCCGDHNYCRRKDCGGICINNNPIIEIHNNGSGSGSEVSSMVKSSYLEALGGTQTVSSGDNIIFDIDSAKIVGDIFTMDPIGEIITINQPGLYHVEWNVNLSPNSDSAVIGILENEKSAPRAATSRSGNFASGTLIQVKTVPFTIGLHNYGSSIEIEDGADFKDSAASIRILKFADKATC